MADGSILRNAAPDDQARYGVVFGYGSELISIAALGMRGATLTDFGDHPLTDAQVEAMCQEAARLSLLYGIPIQSSTVFTHAEIALQNGYGIGSGAIKEVWDFETTEPIGPFVYDNERHNEKTTLTGTLLRNKIRRYVTKMLAWGYPVKVNFDATPYLGMFTAAWHEEETMVMSDQWFINGHLRPPANTDDTASMADEVLTQLN